MMRTINCRDDSLAQNKPPWASIKHRQRCVVVAEGFYEWQHKGTQKLPYFVKRRDGQLLLLAGLWDSVRYDDSPGADPLYTYTIITTDSSPALRFLHDRMPVILDAPEKVLQWLSPGTTAWNKDLQALLVSYQGDLEWYRVSADVGKVGNNSPDFVLPLEQNKASITNFFGTPKKQPPAVKTESAAKAEVKVKQEESEETKIKKEDLEKEEQSAEAAIAENNAPLPLPTGVKREHSDADKDDDDTASAKKQRKDATEESGASVDVKLEIGVSPSRAGTRSATTNTINRNPSATQQKTTKTKPKPKAKAKSKAKDAPAGNAKITSFFK